jgi:dipeptidyl aminopeptidase/acylaminoacyl peptidase
MKQLFTTTLLVFTITIAFGQKKIMDHGVYKIWKRIDKQSLSNDGNWVVYSTICNAECDPTLQLWNATTATTTTFERGADAQFTHDNAFLIFKIKQPLDTLKAKRRKKVKDEDLPKEGLGIYNLATGNLTKIPNVKSFAVPQKWAGYMAYQLDIEKPEKEGNAGQNAENSRNPAKDTSATRAKTKPKLESRENGSKVIALNLATNKKDTFFFATDYTFAKKGKKLLVADTGKDTADQASVDIFYCDLGTKRTLFQQDKAKFKQLAFDDMGTQIAYLADFDTTKERIRPYQLHYWKSPSTPREGGSTATWTGGSVARSNSNYGNLTNYLISDNAKPQFSDDGQKLFFGLAAQPILNDTTLLPEEIVNVEVWAYNENKIHPQQKVQLEAEKKRNYTTVFYPQNNAILPLASPEMPDIGFNFTKNGDYAVGYTSEPYQLAGTWEGGGRNDIYLVDVKNGKRTLVASAVKGFARMSPEGKYISWYNELDSAWFAYSVLNKTTVKLTDNNTAQFYSEENDEPDYPSAYGSGGWTKDDKYLLVYDRFDIWRIDPLSKEKPLRLTNGRSSELEYRYIRLDDEERSIDLNTPLLLAVFNDKTKDEGYAYLSANTQTVTNFEMDNFKYSANVLKAKNANAYVFTKQNFQTTPDLLYTTDFKSNKKVSDINTQQNEYDWGSMELVEWRSLDGALLRGMLVKPEGFDPKKKYPMLVHFYEQSTDEMHTYRTLEPNRASINYAFYANRGYIIFNPDIPYRVGYPGESCLSSVVSGVSHLIGQGFVDEKRIGIQGHSWGGYQAAYLISKTNIFKCAESGAPVVNMVSAYGGIRWESGVLRQFQYEHTQSRIGGTPWQYPLRFIENSPIFSADKIQTPVLILHNDKDGAVPWYQGIEFYSAMRRLNKPAWLLNYNEEGHGIVKLQNRIDFQTRMQQYFDHYLKDAPMPKWMQRGVPAMEKGILQGLEEVKNNETLMKN